MPQPSVSFFFQQIFLKKSKRQSSVRCCPNSATWTVEQRRPCLQELAVRHKFNASRLVQTRSNSSARVFCLFPPAWKTRADARAAFIAVETGRLLERILYVASEDSSVRGKRRKYLTWSLQQNKRKNEARQSTQKRRRDVQLKRKRFINWPRIEDCRHYTKQGTSYETSHILQNIPNHI